MTCSFEVWTGRGLSSKDQAKRNIIVHGASDWSIPGRILNAWSMGSEEDLIATAAVIGDHLYVLTCAFERIEIPFNEIIPLKDLPLEKRSQFEIDEMGSCIYWPALDVHIGVDGFKYLTDAKWRARVDLEVLTYNREFGSAIATVRKNHKLRQSDIEDLTDRQLRRIESGEAHPSVSTLNILAKAHGLNFNDYVNEIGNFLKMRPHASC